MNIILESWCELMALQKSNFNWNNALIAQSRINDPFEMELSSQELGIVENRPQVTEGVVWSPPYHAWRICHYQTQY